MTLVPLLHGGSPWPFRRLRNSAFASSAVIVRVLTRWSALGPKYMKPTLATRPMPAYKRSSPLVAVAKV